MTLGVKAINATGITTFDTGGLIQVATDIGDATEPDGLFLNWGANDQFYGQLPVTFTLARSLNILATCSVNLQFVGGSWSGATPPFPTFSHHWIRLAVVEPLVKPTFTAVMDVSGGGSVTCAQVRWWNLAAGSYTIDFISLLPGLGSGISLYSQVPSLHFIFHSQLSVFKMGGP